MDDPEDPGRDVLGDEAGLDGPGEVTADRALEVGPQVEGHRRVRLAERPFRGELDGCRDGRRDQCGVRAGRRATLGQDQPADQGDPDRADHEGDQKDR